MQTELEEAISDALQPFLDEGKGMLRGYVIVLDYLDENGDSCGMHHASQGTSPSQELGMLHQAVITTERAIWEWSAHSQQTDTGD